MTETARVLLFGAALPLVVAGVILEPWRRGTSGPGGAPRRDGHTGPSPRGSPPAQIAWRAPVAIAAPVVGAFLALYGPPREQWQWTLLVPAAGAVVGLAMGLAPHTRAARASLWVVLAAAVTACIWPVVGRDPLWVKAMPGAGTLALAMGLEPLALRRTGGLLAVALLLATGTSAAIVLVSGFMKLAVPCAAGAVALGVCAVAALRRPLPLGGGALAVACPLLAVVPLVAWLYMRSAGGAVPALSFVLPPAAPLLCWLEAWISSRRNDRGRMSRLAGPAGVALVALACAAAVAIALRASPQRSSSEELYRELMAR